MLLLLICDVEHQVLHFLSDVGPERHEPSINSVHYGLEVIPLSWVFWVKEFKILLHKLFGDRSCHHLTRNVRWHHKLQKKFVDKLKMRPSFFEMGLIFIRVYLLLFFIVCIILELNDLLTFVWKSPKNVLLDHYNRLLENILCQKNIWSIVIIEDINELDQNLLFLVTKFDSFRIFFRISLEICLIVAKFKF